MPATEFQGSSAAAQFGRSVFSLKRHSHVTPVVMDGGQALDLDTFQSHVTDCFQHLSTSSSDLLSLPWLRDLLDSFLRVHHQFNLLIVSTPKSHLAKPAVERLLSDYFERSVKGLDVCNAIRDGIEQMRQWQKLLEIVLCALDRDRTLDRTLDDLVFAITRIVTELEDLCHLANTTNTQTQPISASTLSDLQALLDSAADDENDPENPIDRFSDELASKSLSLSSLVRPISAAMDSGPAHFTLAASKLYLSQREREREY